MPDSPELLPLPVSWEECRRRGWEEYDILLVSGDAYIDHPSFGIALIGRLLEHNGYRVAILPQPRFDSAEDFNSFPEPRLFCGISGGNLDSIVANYSGNGKVRDHDAYSPEGNPWRGKEKNKLDRRRPDRASIIYSSLAKSVFKNTPIILGGVEASLRRFIHYDYKQRKLRGSILTDAKADLLLYGMAEHAVVETAHRLKNSESLFGIQGTCSRLTEKEMEELHLPEESITLPSWQDISRQKELFLEAEMKIHSHARGLKDNILLQHQQSSWVIQHPPAPALTTIELDSLYQLPFTRKPHPSTPKVPAYDMIRDSITIVRGCSGNCSFCAITRHQGPVITSRSRQSIVNEAKAVSRVEGFSGTISDLGGPTANLYGTACNAKTCNRHDCLYPRVCKNLLVDEEAFLALLEDVGSIGNIDHVFISSGMRMELLRKTPKLFEKIVRDHMPGTIKIAPEHTEKEVLELMHKEPHDQLVQFVSQCRKINRKFGRRTQISPYIISAHPGSTAEHTKRMISKLKQLKLTVRGFQDFTPTPGSLSTAMYYSERDLQNRPLFIPDEASRRKQRALLELAFFHNDKTGRKPTRKTAQKTVGPERTGRKRKKQYKR